MDLRTLEQYMNFANKMADEAGKVFKEGYYGEKIVSHKKAEWDLVTDYDRKVEQIITSMINEQYPTHKILAEEDNADKGVKEELGEDPTWIVDPIDGTINYVRGIPFTCISIALAIEKNIVIGIVHNPLTGDKYTAITGQGAYLNGRPIQVSKHQVLDMAHVSFEMAFIRHPKTGNMWTKRFLAILQKTLGIKHLGSAALTLCMVASGGLDLYFQEYLSSWDLAAGVLILKEAKGYVCDIQGEDFDLLGGSVMASANIGIASDVLQIFTANQ